MPSPRLTRLTGPTSLTMHRTWDPAPRTLFLSNLKSIVRFLA